jgi:glutamate dehydrogenase/leucine dehydrogenase
MLQRVDDSVEGKSVAISGSGNVAIYAAEKVLQMGGKVVTLSDSDGFIHDEDGLDEEKLEFVKELKEERRGRIREYAEKFGCQYHEGKRPWGVSADIAMPCATQNELDLDDARQLLENGCKLIVEGANMPCTCEAVEYFLDEKALFGPGKAANAGGVAVSGLEQSQNALRISWSRDEVDGRLRDIMLDIHDQCTEQVNDGQWVNYLEGANVASFRKVADAMLAYGVV